MPLSTRDIIEQGLAAHGLNRARLAHKAGISLDSLNKCMQREKPRPFTARMLVPIAAVLGVTFDELSVAPTPAIAAERLGAYARVSVGWLEGRYHALRHAFQRDGLIIAYAMTIRWDEDEQCLVHLRHDFFDGPIIQRGQVAISSLSGHIHLIGEHIGHFDLSVLGRPAEDGRLQGLTTMLYHRRSSLVPGASPLVFLPVPPATAAAKNQDDPNIPSEPPVPLPSCGEIDAGHPSFAAYSRLLQIVEVQGFAKLAGGLSLV